MEQRNSDSTKAQVERKEVDIGAAPVSLQYPSRESNRTLPSLVSQGSKPTQDGLPQLDRKQNPAEDRRGYANESGQSQEDTTSSLLNFLRNYSDFAGTAAEPKTRNPSTGSIDDLVFSSGDILYNPVAWKKSLSYPSIPEDGSPSVDNPTNSPSRLSSLGHDSSRLLSTPDHWSQRFHSSSPSLLDSRNITPQSTERSYNRRQRLPSLHLNEESSTSEVSSNSPTPLNRPLIFQQDPSSSDSARYPVTGTPKRNSISLSTRSNQFGQSPSRMNIKPSSQPPWSPSSLSSPLSSSQPHLACGSPISPPKLGSALSPPLGIPSPLALQKPDSAQSISITFGSSVTPISLPSIRTTPNGSPPLVLSLVLDEIQETESLSERKSKKQDQGDTSELGPPSVHRMSHPLDLNASPASNMSPSRTTAFTLKKRIDSPSNNPTYEGNTHSSKKNINTIETADSGRNKDMNDEIVPDETRATKFIDVNCTAFALSEQYVGSHGHGMQNKQSPNITRSRTLQSPSLLSNSPDYWKDSVLNQENREFDEFILPKFAEDSGASGKDNATKIPTSRVFDNILDPTTPRGPSPSATFAIANPQMQKSPLQAAPSPTFSKESEFLNCLSTVISQHRHSAPICNHRHHANDPSRSCCTNHSPADNRLHSVSEHSVVGDQVYSRASNQEESKFRQTDASNSSNPAPENGGVGTSVGKPIEGTTSQVNNPSDRMRLEQEEADPRALPAISPDLIFDKTYTDSDDESVVIWKPKYEAERLFLAMFPKGGQDAFWLTSQGSNDRQIGKDKRNFRSKSVESIAHSPEIRGQEMKLRASAPNVSSATGKDGGEQPVANSSQITHTSATVTKASNPDQTSYLGRDNAPGVTVSTSYNNPSMQQSNSATQSSKASNSFNPLAPRLVIPQRDTHTATQNSFSVPHLQRRLSTHGDAKLRTNESLHPSARTVYLGSSQELLPTPGSGRSLMTPVHFSGADLDPQEMKQEVDTCVHFIEQLHATLRSFVDNHKNAVTEQQVYPLFTPLPSDRCSTGRGPGMHISSSSKLGQIPNASYYCSPAYTPVFTPLDSPQPQARFAYRSETDSNQQRNHIVLRKDGKMGVGDKDHPQVNGSLAGNNADRNLPNETGPNPPQSFPHGLQGLPQRPCSAKLILLPPSASVATPSPTLQSDTQKNSVRHPISSSWAPDAQMKDQDIMNSSRLSNNSPVSISALSGHLKHEENFASESSPSNVHISVPHAYFLWKPAPISHFPNTSNAPMEEDQTRADNKGMPPVYLFKSRSSRYPSVSSSQGIRNVPTMMDIRVAVSKLKYCDHVLSALIEPKEQISEKYAAIPEKPTSARDLSPTSFTRLPNPSNGSMQQRSTDVGTRNEKRQDIPLGSEEKCESTSHADSSQFALQFNEMRHSEANSALEANTEQRKTPIDGPSDVASGRSIESVDYLPQTYAASISESVRNTDDGILNSLLLPQASTSVTSLLQTLRSVLRDVIRAVGSFRDADAILSTDRNSERDKDEEGKFQEGNHSSEIVELSEGSESKEHRRHSSTAKSQFQTGSLPYRREMGEVGVFHPIPGLANASSYRKASAPRRGSLGIANSHRKMNPGSLHQRQEEGVIDRTTVSEASPQKKANAAQYSPYDTDSNSSDLEHMINVLQRREVRKNRKKKKSVHSLTRNSSIQKSGYGKTANRGTAGESDFDGDTIREPSGTSSRPSIEIPDAPSEFSNELSTSPTPATQRTGQKSSLGKSSRNRADQDRNRISVTDPSTGSASKSSHDGADVKHREAEDTYTTTESNYLVHDTEATTRTIPEMKTDYLATTAPDSCTTTNPGTNSFSVTRTGTSLYNSIDQWDHHAPGKSSESNMLGFLKGPPDFAALDSGYGEGINLTTSTNQDSARTSFFTTVSNTSPMPNFATDSARDKESSSPTTIPTSISNSYLLKSSRRPSLNLHIASTLGEGQAEMDGNSLQSGSSIELGSIDTDMTAQYRENIDNELDGMESASADENHEVVSDEMVDLLMEGSLGNADDPNLTQTTYMQSYVLSADGNDLSNIAAFLPSIYEHNIQEAMEYEIQNITSNSSYGASHDERSLSGIPPRPQSITHPQHLRRHAAIRASTGGFGSSYESPSEEYPVSPPAVPFSSSGHFQPYMDRYYSPPPPLYPTLPSDSISPDPHNSRSFANTHGGIAFSNALTFPSAYSSSDSSGFASLPRNPAPFRNSSAFATPLESPHLTAPPSANSSPMNPNATGGRAFMRKPQYTYISGPNGVKRIALNSKLRGSQTGSEGLGFASAGEDYTNPNDSGNLGASASSGDGVSERGSVHLKREEGATESGCTTPMYQRPVPITLTIRTQLTSVPADAEPLDIYAKSHLTPSNRSIYSGDESSLGHARERSLSGYDSKESDLDFKDLRRWRDFASDMNGSFKSQSGILPADRISVPSSPWGSGTLQNSFFSVPPSPQPCPIHSSSAKGQSKVVLTVETTLVRRNSSAAGTPSLSNASVSGWGEDSPMFQSSPYDTSPFRPGIQGGKQHAKPAPPIPILTPNSALSDSPKQSTPIALSASMLRDSRKSVHPLTPLSQSTDKLEKVLSSEIDTAPPEDIVGMFRFKSKEKRRTGPLLPSSLSATAPALSSGESSLSMPSSPYQGPSHLPPRSSPAIRPDSAVVGSGMQGNLFINTSSGQLQRETVTSDVTNTLDNSSDRRTRSIQGGLAAALRNALAQEKSRCTCGNFVTPQGRRLSYTSKGTLVANISTGGSVLEPPEWTRTSSLQSSIILDRKSNSTENDTNEYLIEKDAGLTSLQTDNLVKKLQFAFEKNIQNSLSSNSMKPIANLPNLNIPKINFSVINKVNLSSPNSENTMLCSLADINRAVELGFPVTDEVKEIIDSNKLPTTDYTELSNQVLSYLLKKGESVSACIQVLSYQDEFLAVLSEPGVSDTWREEAEQMATYNPRRGGRYLDSRHSTPPITPTLRDLASFRQWGENVPPFRGSKDFEMMSSPLKNIFTPTNLSDEIQDSGRLHIRPSPSPGSSASIGAGSSFSAASSSQSTRSQFSCSTGTSPGITPQASPTVTMQSLFQQSIKNLLQKSIQREKEARARTALAKKLEGEEREELAPAQASPAPADVISIIGQPWRSA